jgi:isopenicillin-N epimerase
VSGLRDAFLLEPGVVFLNHGSFGATPKPVFEAYQRWQLQVERQPVRFFSREHDELMRHSRGVLGEYLGADPDDLVYVQNATQGVNIVARSLDLQPGDEILASNHEYGACEYAWEFVCRKTGAQYSRRQIPLPLNADLNTADLLWEGVTARTRVIFLSHITSPTALRLPVEEICRRARQAGILTLVDGAHASGQLPLDLAALGADFYTGNCHKWMLSPKGAGFLYARPEVQPLIEPLVVSWGFHPNGTPSTGSQFLDYLQWSGTRDPSAALAVPDAIQFMADHHWDQVRRECHWLLALAIRLVCELTGLPPPCPLDSHDFIQMGIAPLPAATDLAQLKARLYNDFRVEVPVIEWEGQKFLRISVQAYNDQRDIDLLLTALRHLLPQVMP